MNSRANSRIGSTIHELADFELIRELADFEPIRELALLIILM